MVGAIAAGCTVILKPSENSPHSSAVMKFIVEKYLDPESFVVVQGGVDISQALLDQKWDKIFYTGGAAVGAVIAMALGIDHPIAVTIAAFVGAASHSACS